MSFLDLPDLIDTAGWQDVAEQPLLLGRPDDQVNDLLWILLVVAGPLLVAVGKPHVDGQVGSEATRTEARQG